MKQLLFTGASGFLGYNILPMGILRTEQDVVNYILTMDYEEEREKTTRMIKNKIATYGGNATVICLNKLFGDE